ncbi:LacI family DNA-binding transcriptional regulator [Streptacidiphilus monticola]|uniref:LacI family DNA-binding transcriptional regulator n=1 Tax=Streptacidiphilus monticola TaxID=2161674 RepID=A0ABW1G2K7_9ACTN
MVTIKDVAARAGVAVSTVSYVLSGSRRISEKTRQAVQQAVDELGYHPSASARTLRGARTNVLALALPRSGRDYRPVDGRFAIELCDAARERGYDVLMLTEREGLRGLRRVTRAGQADGAVLMAVTEDDPRVTALEELGLPYALLGTPHPQAPAAATAPFADLDWAAAVEQAATAAADAGHRHVAYVPCTAPEVADRKGYALAGLAGARAAAARLGPDRLRILEPPQANEELGRTLAKLLADPANRPTALLLQHVDGLATVFAAAATAGLGVPQDLCVVPVGSIAEEHGGRRLPRVELPVLDMAEAVTDLLVRAIDRASRAEGPRAADTRLIPPVLLGADLLAPHRP